MGTRSDSSVAPGRFKILLACCMLAMLASCDSKPPTTRPAKPGPTHGSKPDTAPLLVDVTEAAGISFQHDRYARGEFLFPEINGAGCAFLDYDNDGYLDIFFVQSGCDLKDPSAPAKPCELYHNRGDGTFENVTESSGAGVTGFGQGVAVGDYNNDGYVDIYVANTGPNKLLKNNGNGTFTDATEEAGVGDAGWAIPATFIDFDGDGWLDIYVGNYVIWTPETDHECVMRATGVRDYCGPREYTPQIDVLYRNNGDGTFTDVTKGSGLDMATGPAMSAICADFNNDAMVDIYVANDSFPNQLWISQGDGTFYDEGHISGCAVNERGRPESSMGTNAEDFDGDGDIDLFMVHFVRETSTIFINQNGFFEDRSTQTGLNSLSLPHSTFGAVFFDLYNEGEFYGYMANGKANIEGKPPDGETYFYGEHDQLLSWSTGKKRFEDVTDQVGPAMDVELVSRGVVTGDYDNDGDVDILISTNNGPGRLLQNVAADTTSHHWLMVRCLTADGKRDVIGAQILVEWDGRKRRRDVIVNYSYASSCDPRIHFGLGDYPRADRVTVTWLDGTQSVYTDVPADQIFVVKQPAGQGSAAKPGAS